MSDSSEAIKPRKPVFLTLIGLGACAGMLAMPVLAGPPNGQALPDIMRFLGRFHPVILHLPIGILSLALIKEFASLFSREVQSTRSIMFFAAASSVIAVIAGFLLYQSDLDGEATDLGNRHLWGGIAFSCVTILAYIVKSWTDAGASAAWFYRFLLLISAGVMGFASHDGASMVHGTDYLSKYAPPAIKPLLGGKVENVSQPEGGTPDAAAEPLVYQDVIAPMMEEKCWKCHNADKIKGKFRMDTYELLVKGGKEGAGLVVGDAAKSNIVIRCELPIDDDERMPPDEKPGLTDEQLTVIKWWINAGASPALKLSEANAPADVAAILAKQKPVVKKAAAPAATTGAAPTEAPKADANRDALKAAMAEVQKSFPGAVQFESQASSGLTFTAVSMRGKFSDDDTAKLGPVMAGLVSADFSAALITDKSLALLAPAKGLRSLRISETKVTDAGMDTIAKMTSLESLNLYGTEVTDAGLQKLASLPQLKKLYVWRSKITPAGIAELKKKLPQCVIETGM
jgi:uncharacterized membrane protein